MARGYLFLGGPADGQHKAVPDDTGYVRVRVSKMTPFSPGIALNDMRTFGLSDEIYTRREMTGGHRVYAHTSMPTHEILPRLLRGYSPDAL